MDCFDEIGKKIINTTVGLFLNEKIIPFHSKGTISRIPLDAKDTYCIAIDWYIEGKEILIGIFYSLYEQLLKKEILGIRG